MSQKPKTMAVAKKPSPEDPQVVPAPARPSSASTASKSEKSSKSEESASTKVQVLRIPANRSLPTKAERDTFKIQNGSAHDARTRDLEEQLRHVPDLRHEQNFKWDHRILVKTEFENKELPEEKRGQYYMYKCIDSKLGLPLNKTFEKLKGACVYGDAFVFRLKEPGFSDSGRARYAKMGSSPEQEATNMILCTLAIQGVETGADQSTKSNAVLNTQPISNDPTMNYQPNMPPVSMVEALRLPCDGSLPRITNIPLIKVGHRGLNLKDCLEDEIRLKQFPKMKDLDRQPIFSWEYRQLVHSPVKDFGDSVGTFDLIYVCYRKKAGLERNKFLEKFSGVRMYGDSFLFKVYFFDKDERPDFLHMGLDSIEDLKNEGGATEETLRKLLAPN